MHERIYTIPVSEAFSENCGCPFCRLYEKLEKEEASLILGASMMEPEIRTLTNEKGFCDRHFSLLFGMKNRLGLALMLESHLEGLKKELSTGNIFSRDIAAKSVSRIEKLESDCYVCGRIEEKLSKMLETASYLYAEEPDFRKKLENTGYFCLPHYKMLVLAAKRVLPKEEYISLVRSANEIMQKYLHSLKDDISLFCKKFDYRFDELPWGNSKDSVERAIRFLTASLAPREEK